MMRKKKGTDHAALNAAETVFNAAGKVLNAEVALQSETSSANMYDQASAQQYDRRSFLIDGLKFLAVPLCLAALPGCVNQYPQQSSGQRQDERLVATSPAVAAMCAPLDLDLIGIPVTSFELPKRYQGLPTVGAPMNPDMEKLSTMRPCCAISPSTLIDDLRPKYAAAGVASIFVDLGSVEGLYDSCDYLGKRFARSAQAEKLRADYETQIKDYLSRVEKFESPKVLVLMGVPGTYIVATEKSYAGSLVALAGGKNIYPGEEKPFVTANTEDMLKRDPDIILRTAHALPEQVMADFAKEFATNDIWKHFRAVQSDRVFDLPYELFGMSATFDWPDALEYLLEPLYGQTEQNSEENKESFAS